MPNLFQQFQNWRTRRYWKKRQLAFLQRMLDDDARWMVSEPIISEFITRYRRAASDDWYQHNHEPINLMRERIGLQPKI